MGIESMINWGAVIGAAVAAFVLGALWYGPVFGKQWMKMMKFTPKDAKRMSLNAGQAMAMGIVVQVLVAYVLAHFVKYMQATTVGQGAQLAFWLWLGFSLPLLMGGFMWEGKSIKLVAFNAVHRLIELVLMAAILARWG